jgi:hypothetical protein
MKIKHTLNKTITDEPVCVCNSNYERKIIAFFLSMMCKHRVSYKFCGTSVVEHCSRGVSVITIW